MNFLWINIDFKDIEIIPLGISDSSSSGGGSSCGNSFSPIAYPSTPQYIQDRIDYSKTFYDAWDGSITNCYRMFFNDDKLIYAPLLDTSKVTNMGSMFSGCRNIEYIPPYNTSNVTGNHFERLLYMIK